jgi:hypothetical protein
LHWVSHLVKRKETEAQKTVNSYVVYVDSLEATPADVKMNWESIDAAYNVKWISWNSFVILKENKEATEKIRASKEAEAMKAAFQAGSLQTCLVQNN